MIDGSERDCVFPVAVRDERALHNCECALVVDGRHLRCDVFLGVTNLQHERYVVRVGVDFLMNSVATSGILVECPAAFGLMLPVS